MAEREYSELITKVIRAGKLCAPSCGHVSVLADLAQDLIDERRKRLSDMAEMEIKLQLADEMYPDEMRLVDRAVGCVKKVAVNFAII